MKKIILSIGFFLTFSILAEANNDPIELSSIKSEITELKSKQNSLECNFKTLRNNYRIAQSRIDSLELVNETLTSKISSLQSKYSELSENQENDKFELSSIIGKTNEKVQLTENAVYNRTAMGLCGIIALFIALVVIVWAFIKKYKTGATSIENVRKAQQKMQEETIQLDNKLIEILSKQSISAPITSDNGEIDHSLTLKVADEIIKIEMNLSRMDPAIKGYKQLAKGVQRIKDNFKANDYDIVDMLGKQYQPGMKAAVTFVTDDTLEPGQQIITRIIKPQVNYKQIMIQAAQIEVSQSE